MGFVYLYRVFVIDNAGGSFKVLSHVKIWEAGEYMRELIHSYEERYLQ